MTQLEKFYVVKRTKEKDVEFAVIDAMSLQEANAIFEIRHESDKDAMQEREAFYIFQANKNPKFDENQRLVFPEGPMGVLEKW